MRRFGFHLRSLAAITLTVMALGSVGHFWHHATDSDCDPAGKRGAEHCTCAALHGVAIADEHTVAKPPVPSALGAVTVHRSEHVPAHVRSGASPRAPPSA